MKLHDDAEFKDETARRNGHLYNVTKQQHTHIIIISNNEYMYNFLIYITSFSNRNHNATVAPTILLLY